MAAKSPRSVTAAEFANLMHPLGPFEPAPCLAVGVSGGADSMALTLLADGWARRRGGVAVAVTIDHGLRPESGREATQVGRWLKGQDIEHHVLRWTGEKPRSGVEAAARQARYDLLAAWCRRRGILHLLLAHHRDDQAETVLIRLGRGSGPDGLAAMPHIGETPHVRLLRPLLTVPRARLRAFLDRRGQPWIEDPSNLDPAFTRARIRAAMPALGDEGVRPASLAAAAAKLGRTRAAMEDQTARLLARAVELFPLGYCRIRADCLFDAPEEITLRALSAILTCIGGQPYAPRAERLGRLYGALVASRPARPRTLGGCLISPRRDDLIVTREPEAATGTNPIVGTGETRWDRRFTIRFRGGRAGAAFRLGRLGPDGWTTLRKHEPSLRKTGIPRAAALCLPAIWAGERLAFVPHFEGLGPFVAGTPNVSVVFSPANPLTRATFSVV